MEASLAIAASVFVLIVGLGLFIVMLKGFDKPFLLYYMISLTFFLFGGTVSLVTVLGMLGNGVWILPVIAFVIITVLLGSLLFSIASEEKFLYKYRQLQAPLNPVEVEKGLDWKKLEKWLVKNSKNNR